MIFPHKKDTDLFKAIQDRIEHYATGQSKTTNIEETKKIIDSLIKMRESWLNTFELTLEEANNMIFIQCRF